MLLYQLTTLWNEEQLTMASFDSLLFNFLKIMFIIAGLLYVIFSVIIIRQIRTMQRSLVTSFSKTMQIIGYLHLILSILALLFFVLGL